MRMRSIKSNVAFKSALVSVGNPLIHEAYGSIFGAYFLRFSTDCIICSWMMSLQMNCSLGGINGGIDSFPTIEVVMYSSDIIGLPSVELASVSGLSGIGSKFTVTYLASSVTLIG